MKGLFLFSLLVLLSWIPVQAQEKASTVTASREKLELFRMAFKATSPFRRDFSQYLRTEGGEEYVSSGTLVFRPPCAFQALVRTSLYLGQLRIESREVCDGDNGLRILDSPLHKKREEFAPSDSSFALETYYQELLDTSRYTLETIPHAEKESHFGVKGRLGFRARAISREEKIQEIEAWFEPETGIPGRVVFYDMNGMTLFERELAGPGAGGDIRKEWFDPAKFEKL